MFTITEEQRKQLLQYMWARPYGEVATHIAMLASLKPMKIRKMSQKKICPNCQGNGFVKVYKAANPANDTVMQCVTCNSKGEAT
jgi:RNase P subunit RPR2